MTGEMHIPQEDLALYAMQGLTVEEMPVVQGHLSQCAQCRAELAQVQAALALVGLSAERQPLPAGARDRFLTNISNQPLKAAELPPQIAREPDSMPVVVPIVKKRLMPVWIPWTAAAAFAIAVIGLAVQNKALNDQLSDESRLVTNLAAQASHAQQVLEVLTSPSAERVTLAPGKMPGEPMGHATYLAERGGLIFQASNFKQTPNGMTYELWLIPANGHPPIPAGTFEPDATGSASVVMPPLPARVPAKAFGVTMEKAGGSQTPTMPILLAGAVGGE